jgi:hypothetical protein
MNTARTRRPKVRAGDWVTFQYGTRQVFAQVIDEGDPFSPKSLRRYRVRLEETYTDPTELRMHEDKMEKAVPDKAAIIQYLKQGGLADLLRTNLQEGEDPPRVWLMFTRYGQLTHTLNPVLKVTGKGTPAPFFAVLKNKVYAPDKAKVVEYLTKSFGLTPEEAEDVVQAVGTAP